MNEYVGPTVCRGRETHYTTLYCLSYKLVLAAGGVSASWNMCLLNVLWQE